MMRIFLVFLLTIGAIACNQQTTSDPSNSSLSTVNTALQGSDSRVLSFNETPNKISIGLSGHYSENLETKIINNLTNLDKSRSLEFHWRFSDVGSQATRATCTGAARVVYPNPKSKPSSITGARIMLNPGHGMTLKDSGIWAYQRPVPPNEGSFLHEDLNNLEMAIPIGTELNNVGAIVSSTRELDFNAGIGLSNLEKWKEAARHHVQALDIPDHVWNSEGNPLGTDCNMGKDIRVRPFYANYLGVDALIGLHSNAFTADSNVRGLRVYYPSVAFTNDIPNESLVQSADLATKLSNSVLAAIQQDFPALGWTATLPIPTDGLGEVNYAKMPAVIIEVGFHTNTIDSAAMTDPNFRLTLARGVKNGLEQFFGAAIPIPEVPMGLTAAMSSNGRMFLSWLEVGNSERYKFSATFDGQPVQISGDVLHGLEARGGAVVTFQSNPSAPKLQGHEVCFAMQSVNARGMSTISSLECLPYVFYSSGSLQNTKTPLPRLTIVRP
jgi:N-acetylmuramoyl-L-alanine amidase